MEEILASIRRIIADDEAKPPPADAAKPEKAAAPAASPKPQVINDIPPSKVAPPKAPFTYVREDPSGTQPKLFVRDAAGVTWNVKFGYEVHNESFCWRIVQACGYFAEPSFYIAEGQSNG